MKYAITLLTAILFLITSTLKSQTQQTDYQFIQTNNSQEVDLMTVQTHGNKIVVIINQDQLERIKAQALEIMKTGEQFMVQFDQPNQFVITSAGQNKSTFEFMGREYESLEEIDHEIEQEEQLMMERGYFKFMDDWYPSLELIDSMTLNEKQQVESFEFLGEEYAPMPEEASMISA